MSLSSVTSATFDGDLTDSDFNPLYDLINIIGEVAEDMTEWYQDSVDRTSIGAEWLNWMRESTAGGNKINEQDYAERTEFSSWLNTLSVSPKYFRFDNQDVVSGIVSDYKTEDILELLSIQLDTLSTNASQVLIFTEGLINDYNDSSQELKDLTDALRSAGKGHVRV